MNVEGKPRRTIWLAENGRDVAIIDQRALPHRFVVETLHTLEDAAAAIRDMHVRGAPLIGAVAAENYPAVRALLARRFPKTTARPR